MAEICCRHKCKILTTEAYIKNPFEVMEEDVTAAAPSFNVIEENDVNGEYFSKIMHLQQDYIVKEGLRNSINAPFF